MRWGRQWGKRWGSEEYVSPQSMPVRIVRGRIIPCDSCQTMNKCAMYQSFTRNRLRQEYSLGTNILHTCNIYVPNKLPQNIRAPLIHGRTEGKTPT